MSGSVVSLGCPSKSWDRSVVVAPHVQRDLDHDPSLRNLLASKLDAHGERLPRWLRRGSFHLTPCWTCRKTGRNIVIVTYCRDDGRPYTSVRELSAHHRSRS